MSVSSTFLISTKQEEKRHLIVILIFILLLSESEFFQDQKVFQNHLLFPFLCTICYIHCQFFVSIRLLAFSYSDKNSLKLEAKMFIYKCSNECFLLQIKSRLKILKQTFELHRNGLCPS